ncbi:MAG: zinc metallopeptidase [Lachnospiraceae bacterium]|nr:zinc metallopeptidase [Lachnospiraceae bacterium]
MYKLVELQAQVGMPLTGMWQPNRLIWIGTLILLGLIVVIEILRVLLKYIHSSRQGRQLNHGRVWLIFYRNASGRMIMVLGIAVCLSLGARMIFGPPAEESGQERILTILEVPDDEEAVAEQAKNLQMLRQENYPGLSSEEKIAELQKVADIVLSLQGCGPVEVVSEKMDKGGVRGYYSDAEKRIVISEDVLEETAESAISVVLHECAHAYQFACVSSVDWKRTDTNLRLYREVVRWKLEMDNYVTYEGQYSPEEYDIYANQSMEQHAEAFSSTWTMRFMKNIEKY